VREFHLDVHGQFAALLHDAHEAFTNDIRTPAKDELGVPWAAFEYRFERLVRKAFAIHVTDGNDETPVLPRENVVISVAGASPQQIERAHAAVHAMFEAAEVSPAFAARSAHKLESWDRAGFPPEQMPSNVEFDAAQLWLGIPDCVIESVFGSERPANASSLVDVFLPPVDRTPHQWLTRRCTRAVRTETPRTGLPADQALQPEVPWVGTLT